uniref:Taurine dioxygenase, alpha-ketoglutarate-dependent n=1 Tax=Candidatus Kentrum sp. MB TaxID=2138164 RepID=A0A450XUZ7_9GAMM|nr:MAG: Taurine dioxygenase, alpha-ketoglutarate-dependent [Candidatus Kentron sp. MB]VFK76053.1 MAG: Taurine dioxygenase, alpha-ketoglutarate-dependent [Candidatus Kentron sp. MB]
MTNPKADFNNLYTTYLPSGYVKHIVQNLRYHLPFLAMEKLKPYRRSLLWQDVVRIAMVGSAHGLDAIALKYALTTQEIVARWMNDDTVGLPWPASESGYEVTLIDMEAEPLRFASDIHLSDHSFVADLNRSYSAELQQHLAEMTDVVSAVGVISYLGLEGMERLIQTALVNGNAGVLYFSVLRYLDANEYVDLCRKHGLIVRYLGDLPQRLYENTEEKHRIQGILKNKGLLTEADESGLVASLFLAYKGDSVQSGCDPRIESAGTLAIVEQGDTLVGSTQDHHSPSVADWVHPWHIALSKEDAENPAIFRKLVEFHLKGELQPGDRVTVLTDSSVHPVDDWASMFAAEYEISEPLPDSAVRQEFTKIEPVINANILNEIPASSELMEAELRKFGHALIRTGSPIDEAQVFDLLGGIGNAMDYQYGNAARRKIEDSASLEVTPWPKELSILPHNELTYHVEFPKNASFICKKPAPYGGETSIYDCVRAFENLSSNLQSKAKNHDVIFYKRYVQAIDHERYPSWQRIVGENATHEDLIEHFTQIGYDCAVLELEENGRITTVVETRLKRPTVYEYQGRLCLHASIVGISPYWYEKVWPGREPPLTVSWDDGNRLSFEEFRQMDKALSSARIFYNNWQQHDVMILDNAWVAHGRMPFIGERTIGVLMAKPARFKEHNGSWNVELVA